jgi:hypothetical protein
MSSPDTPETTEERHLTIIVVPHGDLETRSFVLSYGKLKVLIVLSVLLLLAFAIALAVLFPVMAQAARVPRLEAELRELETQRAQVVELARELQEVEARYERVRQLLGADAPGDGETEPLLPPLRREGTTGDTAEVEGVSLEPSPIELWPLERRGSSPGP